VGEIIGIIAKSVLVAVVGSAATILINKYWGDGNEAKSEPKFADEEGRPNYHF